MPLWPGVIVGPLPLSLILFTYERALIPLYGSGPTKYTLNNVILTICLATAVYPFRISMTWIWPYAALSLSLAPNATYWVAVWTSRRRDPLWGPTLTHIAVLAPLIFIWTTCAIEVGVRRPTQAKRDGSRPPMWYRLVIAGMCYGAGTFLSGRFWPNITYLNQVSESEILLGLAGTAYAACIWSSPTPSKTLLTALQNKTIFLVAFAVLWWSIYPYLSSPVLPHPLKQTYTHPSFPLQVHSSVQSTTGLIVVGEALAPPKHMHPNGRGQDMYSVRYLRASHSILGGVWMGNKVVTLGDMPVISDSFGSPLGDSIYSAFVLQEAVRLIDSTAKGRTDSLENGLIIGLGAGISATAFHRHAISTTIVEIDLAVYDAARTFFGLPDPGPGKVFLEDARSWAATRRANVRAGKNETLYDFIVHDCFSGGGVPEHIFTLEFWKDLQAVLHPEGVVVVNFAGIPASDSSKMVLHTLEKSFGQCRGFHDLPGDLLEKQYTTEFVNIVFFCTLSKVPLTFRRARRQDYLGSPIRRHFLDTLSQREVRLDLVRTSSSGDGNRYILTDEHNPLGKLQDQQGLHHWSLMRDVLPDVHWETY